MDGGKIIGYNAFSAEGVDTTAFIEAGGDSKGPRDTTTTKTKDDGDWCSTCMLLGMLVLNTLLTFIFAIVIIVLTAVGKGNISTYDGRTDLDKKCDCTSFTPSLSYGLAVSLFIEIGLMVTLIILAGITTLIGNNKYSKLLEYYGYVAGSFIGLNFIGFLCMTIAVIVFVAMGTSACCSATSIVVASLSTFLVVIKTLFVCCLCCFLLVND